MKKTLVVVADLASFKAYTIDYTQPNHTPRLEPVLEVENDSAHAHVVDLVSDLGGRFPRGGGGGMSAGERHNMDLEMRKRLVRNLAQQLNALARDPEIESFLLAASREINGQLVAELDPQVRAKIGKNLPADLTKLERAAILARF